MGNSVKIETNLDLVNFNYLRLINMNKEEMKRLMDFYINSDILSIQSKLFMIKNLKINKL